MLGFHLNPMLDFREHFIHITKDVRKGAKTLAKRKLSPSLKTPAVEQLLKSKYHATHFGVFDERQLTTIDDILNKATRQAIDLLPNFPMEEVQRPMNEASLGLPPMRDRSVQMGIEHLTRIVNKYSERGFTAHAHVNRLISRFDHWPLEALESNPLKIPTLRILRHANTIPGLGFESLPPLHQANAISSSIRYTSLAVNNSHSEQHSTLQGHVGNQEYDKLVRQQCKPITYSHQLLEHLAPLWELGIHD